MCPGMRPATGWMAKRTCTPRSMSSWPTPHALGRAGAPPRRRAEAEKQQRAQRAVPGLPYQLREQRAGRADHGAGDDHGGIVEHEALESDRTPGERVAERD